MSKIRLTEAQLHNVIKDSINKILKENFNNVTWIIVDKATDGIVETYDSRWSTKEEAIYDANKMAKHGGGYNVYECEGNSYGEENLIYTTDDLDYKI